jgi:maleylpyruvate isomerase
LFECASRGEIGDQYPGGLEQRNADIEQGATRSAAELVADLRSQVWNLEGQWARATPQAWQGSARRPGGAIVSVSDLVFLRWREVAIHLVDLNVGCDHSSWSDLYVEMETRKQLDSLSVQGFEVPGAARTLEPSLQLAWLIGRATVEGLHESPGFQI